MKALRPSAQDSSVARLEAQPARIGRHVRAALVDDADHADWGSYPGNLEAVGALPFCNGLAHWVGQGGNIVEPLGHGFNPVRCQSEPVDEGGPQI